MNTQSQQPYITTADGKRRFACSPTAILVFIVNEHEEILLLAHPKWGGSWEVVNGALEAQETIVEGALRETREEIGEEVQVRPLGTVHTWTFHYDEKVRYMISVGYLMAYEGGSVKPGSDMAGSRYRWWGIAELSDENVKILIPPEGKWIIERAIECYRMWKGRKVELQPDLVLREIKKK